MSILHFGEHHKNALRSNIIEFTEQFGSKAGILEFLRTFPDLQEHILPGFSINHETLASGNIPNLPADFRGMEKSLIYRSSHPDDHRGYIGMLPTIVSRHYEKETIRSVYQINNHELNIAKVYNTLAYYQRSGKEKSYSNNDFSIDGFYNLYGYPLSDPRQSYTTRESISGEYSDFIDAGEYGYHIDYYKLYLYLLEKVKKDEDTTDYHEKALRITNQRGWDYREMTRTIQEKIRTSIGYKERGTGLRTIQQTGIYIQPEVLPNGGTMGGVYESPHKKGVYIIAFRAPTMESDKERTHPNGIYDFSDAPISIIYDSETGEIKEIEGNSYRRCGFIPKIIELYKKVKEKNIFGEDYSFHMEFGFNGNKLLIYQVRQFSPYQEANFKINNQCPRAHIVRGITDEVGEKVIITLLGDYSSNSRIQESTNIGIKYSKEELECNIPLRQRILVSGTGYGRLDDDHGITRLLYETGGIAVVGTLPGVFPNRNYDKTQTYTGTLFSDGVNVVMEGVEEIDA